jgi:hypothetical protein
MLYIILLQHASIGTLIPMILMQLITIKKIAGIKATEEFLVNKK